jgi:hypothetical protein
MQIQRWAFALFIALFLSCSPVFAQQLIKRTTTKTDKMDFGAGGTVSVTGAPLGSIRIVGGARNEVSISAEIEMQAATEADLARLAEVTTYVLDEGSGRIGIVSSGTHNKLGDKKLWKKFPKNLMDLPFRIDYTISVPRYCDLQIDGGKGDISVSGVEGTIRTNSLESNSKLDLIGGSLSGTFGSGNVDITMPDRSWRGNAIDVQLTTGVLSVTLPANLSAELDAAILRTGKIENAFTTFKPRVRTVPFTDRSLIAKAGSGGVSMKFTVGDGTIRLIQIGKPAE